MGEALLETDLVGLAKRRGKVRDVYDLDADRELGIFSCLLIVATDRISAYDWILPNGIPDKGRVLTGLSAFWFRRLNVVNHVINANYGTDVDHFLLKLPSATRKVLAGRSMQVQKLEILPFECVVRGYLAGSAWREYRTSGTVCGQRLPAGLVESDRIDPIFTPATKAETGHDENIPFARLEAEVGKEWAWKLRDLSLNAYRDARAYAESRGLILADTKFEWGIDRVNRNLILADEALTPDSSRYWPLDGYEPGRPQPSFDKQYVRDWLDASGWDKASPPPPLPEEVVAKTREKYIQAYEILTGQAFPWK